MSPGFADLVPAAVRDVPPCPRCEQPGLLLVSYAHTWTNTQGTGVPGRRESLLCRDCDHRDPAAADLLALFLVDGQVREQNLALLQELAWQWATTVSRRRVDETRLTAEEELWREGQL
jgi:hypothetical protein